MSDLRGGRQVGGATADAGGSRRRGRPAGGSPRQARAPGRLERRGGGAAARPPGREDAGMPMSKDAREREQTRAEALCRPDPAETMPAYRKPGRAGCRLGRGSK